jgi:hypothetical protein
MRIDEESTLGLNTMIIENDSNGLIFAVPNNISNLIVHSLPLFSMVSDTTSHQGEHRKIQTNVIYFSISSIILTLRVK